MASQRSRKDEFDYIVIGGGSAGCVLAARLSEDPAASVLLIERGESYPRWRLGIPLLGKRFMGRYLDSVATSPQQDCDGRRIVWLVPRVMGGGSSINSMLYLRGQAEAYDRWESLGATGWGYRGVLPYFRKMEDFEGGADRWHGAGGPVAVSTARCRTDLGAAFLKACGECGLGRNDDFAGPSHLGAGWYHFTQANGLRSSTATGHLSPARGRPNLTIWSRATADALLLEQDRVVAVRGRRRRRPFVVRAGGEIILAAGALGSPRLLLLSGIGPADDLIRLGIEPVHHLPGVGRGLQDHPRCGMIFDSTRTPSLSPPALALGLVQWALTRRGLLTSSLVAAGAFLRLSPGSGLLDCQVVASFRGHPALPGSIGLSLLVMDVESRGRVRLASSDPDAFPIVDPRYLAAQRDRAVLVSGIRAARELAATRALRQFGLGAERHPGPDVQDVPGITRYIQGSVETAFHPAGTCAMGPGDEAVVDPELRVRGLAGLRVADASIMPALVNGNTNGPAIMIGEKAADLIRGRSSPILAAFAA